MWCFPNPDLCTMGWVWGSTTVCVWMTNSTDGIETGFVFLFNDASYVNIKYNWQKQPWCDAQIVCRNRLWCKPRILKNNQLESRASWAALQHILQLGCASSESRFMFVSYVIALSLPPTSLTAHSILYYMNKGKKCNKLIITIKLN